jgi:hypothetical protein
MEKKYHGEVVHTWKFKPLKQEPSLDMFSDADKAYMMKLARIVWRMVYDTPAMKERFDRNA